VAKTLRELQADVELLKASSSFANQETVAPVATSGLSNTDPVVPPAPTPKRAAKKKRPKSSSYPPHPDTQSTSDKPVLDHPRLRIIAAIEQHTGTKLAKSIGHEGYDDAEGHFQQLVSELADRPAHHEHHEAAAGALIAASRNLLAARNHLESRQDGSPSRLERFHARVGIPSPADRHVAAAQGLLHTAHTLIAKGDLTLNHLYGDKHPLPEFAKAPVPPMPDGASPIATMMARHRGDLKPVKGTARLLANVVAAKNTSDAGGPQARLLPAPAVRPVEAPALDEPKSLLHTPSVPVVAKPQSPGGPKSFLAPKPAQGTPRNEPRRLG
jgi:hypothetical protein